MVALQEALLGLIDLKPFDEIAIKDITEAAGISYPTFFRRCASKAELLNQIAAEEVQNLLTLGEEAMLLHPSEATSLSMFDYVASKRTLWRTLLTGGAKAAIRDEFMKIAGSIAASRTAKNPWIPLELSVPFVTSGIIEVLTWWLGQPDDCPIELASDYYDSLVVAPIMDRHQLGSWSPSRLDGK